MVLHKHGDRLYSGVAEALHSHLAVVASRIEAAQGLPFLRELVTCWNEHNKSTQMIRDILMVRCVRVCVRVCARVCVCTCASVVQLGCRSHAAACVPPPDMLPCCFAPCVRARTPPRALAQYMDRTYVTQQHKTQVFQLGLDLWREQVRLLRTPGHGARCAPAARAAGDRQRTHTEHATQTMNTGHPTLCLMPHPRTTLSLPHGVCGCALRAARWCGSARFTRACLQSWATWWRVSGLARWSTACCCAP
jgi:hypothetical protein